MKKKKFQIPFDNKWLWAAVSSVVILPTLAMAWSHAGKVWAAPKAIEEVKEDQDVIRAQTTKIGEWVEQSKKETDMRKKAPKGFRYEESIGEYIEWPDDPRLKRKK